MYYFIFNLFKVATITDSQSVIDLEFVHAKSKCFLKTSIMIIIGEQSSKYPFALFPILYPPWSFLCSRDREHRCN